MVFILIFIYLKLIKLNISCQPFRNVTIGFRIKIILYVVQKYFFSRNIMWKSNGQTQQFTLYQLKTCHYDIIFKFNFKLNSM